MIIRQGIIGELTASAQASPRLRMNVNLWNGPED